MNNWTIGPWCVEAAASNGVVDSDDAYAVMAIDDGSDDWHIAAVWRDCPGANPNAHLIAAAPDLYEALAEIVRRARQPDEGINEHYERIAQEFMDETGMMAPGKDDAAGYHGQEERRRAWELFCAKPIDLARVALAKARGE